MPRRILNDLEFCILKRLFPRRSESGSGSGYERNTSLATLMGDDFFSRIKGKVVVDFGCGTGADAVELAKRGARRVIGIDIRDDFLRIAQRRASDAGVQEVCTFVRSTQESADFVVSVDAFEHFSNPAEILQAMSELLVSNGEAVVSFGPTWYHPLGGHLFSVFPWAHLILSENALIRWRSTFKSDGATRFHEVEGGLNQMTIAKFEQLVSQSPFVFASFDLVPIKKLRWLHSRETRECTTAVVRCWLARRDSAKARYLSFPDQAA